MMRNPFRDQFNSLHEDEDALIARGEALAADYADYWRRRREAFSRITSAPVAIENEPISLPQAIMPKKAVG